MSDVSETAMVDDEKTLSVKNLLNGHPDEALKLILETENKMWLFASASDLISEVAKYVNDSNEREVTQSYQSILCEICKHTDPEDTFFELLDKVDDKSCYTMLESVLLAMDIVLHRLSSRKNESLKWFLQSILNNLDAEQITDKLFNSVNEFVVKYIQELVSSDAPFFLDCKGEGQQIICNFLLKALASLSNHPAMARTIVKNIADTVPSLDLPLLQFLKPINSDNIPENAFLVLYFWVFCEQIGIHKFPAVYSPRFMFNCGTGLAGGLLELSEPSANKQGLALLQVILQGVETHSISHTELSSPNHARLFSGLSSVMVFHPIKKVRQQAVSLLRKYVESFNPKGRHLFLVNALINSNQQGVTALLITFIKEFALEYITSDSNNYFKQHIPQLVILACQVPKVKDTALFDASDQAITALSLIRFLSVKDPKPGTLGTGIWDLEAKLKTNFVEPLTEMLKQSNDHLKQQLRDAECLRQEKNKDIASSVLNVDVEGMSLPAPSYEEELAGIKSKMVTLELIQLRLDIAQEGWGN